MSKVSIEEIEYVLSKQKLDKTVVTKVLKDLNDIVEELKNNKEPGAKKGKNEFLIVLSDPLNELKDKEFVGWILQKGTEDDSGLVLDKIRTAARETEESQKRKKRKFETFADAFLGIKRKFIKDKNILIKTKNSVRVLITDGKL